MAEHNGIASGGGPVVISSRGRFRFMRGMAVAALLRRGVSLEDADRVSRSLRDRIPSRAEITTTELTEETDQLLEELAISATPSKRQASPPQPKMVRSAEGVFPFSRGLLVRSLGATGLAIEDAVALAQEVSHRVHLMSADEVAESRVQTEILGLLEREHGSAYARRYELTRWIGQTSQPAIILIGGAAGTGKSTTATQLAYLLGIRKVTSTDMIREAMRTVLSAEVVPGLHDHSFRGLFQAQDVLSKPRERVLAGFHQQAAQVAVGIRGIIRRAVRENANMVIEGTHILPPFSQYASPGEVAMLTGVILAVPTTSDHRNRFPKRARVEPLRDPRPYLDAFQSVRWIHDDLVRRAENHGALAILNYSVDETVTQVVDYLSHILPMDDRPASLTLEATAVPPTSSPRTLIAILDGLADERSAALGEQTPLAAAHTPTLRLLAGEGVQGLLRTGDGSESAPSTATGLMSVLAPPDFPVVGRGLLEALGGGIPLQPDAVFLRGNMATVDPDGVVLDRRAGRIRTGVGDLVLELRSLELPGGIIGDVYPGHEHRVIVSLRGPGLSPAVGDTDPGGAAPVQRVARSAVLDDTPEAARTAEALGQLLAIARQHLAAHPHNAERVARGLHPANIIITRGAARSTLLPERNHARGRSAVISACPTALGVGRTLGMKPVCSGEMTGNLDTNTDLKFATAVELLRDHTLVVVHIKGADIAAHSRRPLEKRDFISAVDSSLRKALDGADEITGDLRVVVTADHGTSSMTGNHMASPVPLLIARWDPSSEAVDFDEESAEQGALGLLGPGDLSDLLWPASGRDNH